jgi:hypothetical protein
MKKLITKSVIVDLDIDILEELIRFAKKFDADVGLVLSAAFIEMDEACVYGRLLEYKKEIKKHE